MEARIISIVIAATATAVVPNLPAAQEVLPHPFSDAPTGWTTIENARSHRRGPFEKAPASHDTAGNGGSRSEIPPDTAFGDSGFVPVEAYEDLLERVESLEAGSPGSPPPRPAPEAPRDQWTVKLGGHVQLDYITWPDADPAIDGAGNYFNYRRLRLVADGTGYRQFDFRLQMTLESGEGSHDSPLASPDVKDVYLSVNEIPWIGRIRIGNFFVPFSLEQVTNDRNNLFNERSIPTQGIFSADREVGIAFYNCTDDQNITWAGGFFFDSLSDTFKTRIDDNQGYRLSGRLTWLPFYDEASQGRYLMHLGTGILHTDDQDERIRFRARPHVQRGPILIDSGSVPASSYTTGNVELAIVWGRVALQGEAFLSRANLLAEDATYIGGAYSHLSYFLTGENRVFQRFGQHGAQFGNNKPFNNLSLTPCEGGWGAWEAKARVSYLDLTSLESGYYYDLTAGLNWYWSDRTRIMLDWIHPWTSEETVFAETSSDLIAMRFDFNW